MKKYLIVLKVKHLYTGEVTMMDWKTYDKEPTEEEIIEVKNKYNDAFQGMYSERAEYAKVVCIYV